jgi:hypothetical protein
MDAAPLQEPATKRNAPTLLSDEADIETQLRVEIEAMMRHAFSTGLEIPQQVMDVAEQVGLSNAQPPAERGRGAPLAKLAVLHAQLAKVVAPAMPGTLHLLRVDSARSGTMHALLGPLSNVRRLMVAALVFMLGFMLISLSPSIDHAAMARDIYTMHGFTLLTVLCFLLSAAGMGSTFQALFTAHVYVSNATYDPRYDASYWIRIGLGLVAGLLLSVLVPINASIDAPTVAKPVMALLGGFSAGLVYRILQRLVETVESLFQGDREAMRLREGDLTRAGAQQAVVEARMDVASQLVNLRDEMAQGASPQRLNESLSAVLDGLLQKRGDSATASAARVRAG